MEKRLVTTRADENVQEMINLTHPIIEAFVKRWNADFLVMDFEPEPTGGDSKWWSHYRIFKLYDYFNEYDRILMMDSDMVINKHCPDPFDEVPVDCIGTIYEDVGSREPFRRQSIKTIQGTWGDIGYKVGYPNTGFFLTSKQHRDIFRKYKDFDYWTDTGQDDVNMGFNIHLNKFKVHQLSYKWNHMTMFSEDWNGNPNRFESYIIHYAGKGCFEPFISDRMDQMRYDIDQIWGDHENIKEIIKNDPLFSS